MRVGGRLRGGPVARVAAWATVGAVLAGCVGTPGGAGAAVVSGTRDGGRLFLGVIAGPGDDDLRATGTARRWTVEDALSPVTLQGHVCARPAPRRAVCPTGVLSLSGGAGDDRLRAAGVPDGAGEPDVARAAVAFDGGPGSDTLTGGPEADVFVMDHSGHDLIDGGGGDDWLAGDAELQSAPTIDLAAGTIVDGAATATVRRVEHAIIGLGVVRGDEHANRLSVGSIAQGSLAEADGRGGNDLLHGWGVLDGGAGDDTFRFFEPMLGNRTIVRCGPGRDTVQGAQKPAAHLAADCERLVPGVGGRPQVAVGATAAIGRPVGGRTRVRLRVTCPVRAPGDCRGTLSAPRGGARPTAPFAVRRGEHAVVALTVRASRLVRDDAGPEVLLRLIDRSAPGAARRVDWWSR